MSVQRLKFREVIKQYPKSCSQWEKLIPPKTDCVVATYSQGEDIYSARAKYGVELAKFNKPLGIVLSGRAELYDVWLPSTVFTKNKTKSVYYSFAAYRPIRILNRGDIFGEFSVLDELNGLDGASRSGETWRISAGFKSSLITKQMQDSDIQHLFGETGDIDGDEILNVITHKLLDTILSGTTVIAYVDGNFIKKNSDIYYPLLEYAWKRAKIYRDCINSFNYTRKLDFERKAERIADRFVDKKDADGKPYLRGKVGLNLFAPLFFEALYDVCNRPFRCEPMFIRGQGLIVKEGTDIEKTFNLATSGLKVSDILVASDSYKENDFWFPLDIANYLIASYSDKSTTMDIVVQEPEGSSILQERTRAVVSQLGLTAEIIPEQNHKCILKLNNKRIEYNGAAPSEQDIMAAIHSATKVQSNNAFLDEINKIYGGKRVKLSKKYVNARSYYKDLTNHLLTSLLTRSAHYPYSVSCIDMPGLEYERQHLMLHFKPKTK